MCGAHTYMEAKHSYPVSQNKCLRKAYCGGKCLRLVVKDGEAFCKKKRAEGIAVQPNPSSQESEAAIQVPSQPGQDNSETLSPNKPRQSKNQKSRKQFQVHSETERGKRQQE